MIHLDFCTMLYAEERLAALLFTWEHDDVDFVSFRVRLFPRPALKGI